jgi:BirA family biotin operon repressor/biotin-[acetyl-CoA-carboxylase] ligase
MEFALGHRAATAGYRLAAFDQIGSTNAEAMQRARDGERGPMWFVTTDQTAGRGRRQRAWISPRGNLASSILEVMDVTPAVAATLGFAAGLALEAALRKVLAAPGVGTDSTLPQPANARFRLGDILVKRGRTAEAKAEYEAALRLNPQLDAARAALKKCCG